LPRAAWRHLLLAALTLRIGGRRGGGPAGPASFAAFPESRDPAVARRHSWPEQQHCGWRRCV